MHDMVYCVLSANGSIQYIHSTADQEEIMSMKQIVSMEQHYRGTVSLLMRYACVSSFVCVASPVLEVLLLFEFWLNFPFGPWTI